jgi:hypothetical protein
MKKTLLTLMVIGTAYASYAQSNIFESGSDVGIGISNPSGKLEILGQSNGDQLVISRNVLRGGEGPGITFKNIINSGTIEKIGGIESQLKSGSTGAVAGSLNLFTINNSNKVNAISITPSGNVGVGTTTPSGGLEVLGQSNGDQLIISRNVLGASEGPGITFKNIINSGTIEKIGGIESQLKSGSTGAVAGSLNLFTINNSNKVNAICITPNGNVGVGTPTPSGGLEVLNQSNGDQLVISRNVLGANQGPGITFKNMTNSGIIEKIGGIESQLKSGSAGAVAGSLNLFTINNSTKVDAISVAPDGNVGIGTADTKGYKLAINGKIRSSEIKVETDNWPDYVFELKYHLISLPELKNYIDQNKHLPELPTAEEVTKNGINLGQIVKLQTKKIEELTLYLIEKDKQFDNLRKDSLRQQQQLNELKHQLYKVLSQR